MESFVNAMKRYYVGAIAKHAISDDPEVKKATFEANTPDLDHIQNLALKFRFFLCRKRANKA